MFYGIATKSKKVSLDATTIVIQEGSMKTSYKHLTLDLRLGKVCLQKFMTP